MCRWCSTHRQVAWLAVHEGWRGNQRGVGGERNGGVGRETGWSTVRGWGWGKPRLVEAPPSSGSPPRLQVMVRQGTLPFVLKKRPLRIGVLPRYAESAKSIRWFETGGCGSGLLVMWGFGVGAQLVLATKWQLRGDRVLPGGTRWASTQVTPPTAASGCARCLVPLQRAPTAFMWPMPGRRAPPSASTSAPPSTSGLGGAWMAAERRARRRHLSPATAKPPGGCQHWGHACAPRRPPVTTPTPPYIPAALHTHKPHTAVPHPSGLRRLPLQPGQLPRRRRRLAAPV